jgi:hypothetical protein
VRIWRETARSTSIRRREGLFMAKKKDKKKKGKKGKKKK